MKRGLGAAQCVAEGLRFQGIQFFDKGLADVMKTTIDHQGSPKEKPPAVVSILGYGGLIPFILAALGQGVGFFSDLINRSFLALAYGAVILSFVGALHWAFAMMLPKLREQRRQGAYIWSVLPALMGFLALMLSPLLGFAVLVIGFALAYWQDLSLAREVHLPGWYLPLRARLSGVACATLILGMLLVSA